MFVHELGQIWQPWINCEVGDPPPDDREFTVINSYQEFSWSQITFFPFPVSTFVL